MKRNETCYIVENAFKVSKGTVIRVNGNLYTIKLDKGTVMRLPGHRLFADEESAAKTIPKNESWEKSVNPYYYMH